MTYERVTVVLTEYEMERLRKIAQRELRRPRDQAAYILRSILCEAPGATRPPMDPPAPTPAAAPGVAAAGA